MMLRLPPAAPLTVELHGHNAGTASPDSGLKGYGIACDIGTTTVVCHLVELSTGRVLATAGEGNAQRAYGADVIARIRASMDGLMPALTSAITGQLSRMIGELCRSASVPVGQISRMAVAANTTMCHLLAGLPPDSIGVAPFTPVSLFGDCHDAKTLGLPFDGEVYICPAVSGYVGGDITADTLCAGLDKRDAPALLIDAGTNGEMALGCGDRFVCCSTAAGPALEGAQIRFGMTAAPGAISEVRWADGKVVCPVIGDGEPAFRLAGQVAVTQSDVRMLQLAKGAIAAGIRVLLDSCGADFDQVGELLLAGGFGSYIRPESAVRIGLIPAELVGVTRAVGNAAAQGALEALVSAEARTRLANIQKAIDYLELSGLSQFNDAYMDAMMFPEE